MQKKLVVFDMNDTLIKGNTWADFNSSMGLTEKQDWDLYSAFSKNEITYDDWLLALKKLYNLNENKHSKEQVLEYLTQYNIKEDAHSALQEINKTEHQTLLLSGSFQITADAVAFELGIQEAIATNNCIFDNDGMLYDIESAGDEQHAKVNELKKLCEERNISLTDCVIIGDGDNDKELFKLTEHSVTFMNSDKETKVIANHEIRSLTELPELLRRLT
jgi:HAD superfamily phosphoserine phosphatase-like hydrolase